MRSDPSPQLVHQPWADDIQTPGLYYRFSRKVCQILASWMWGMRVLNRHREPASGGVVYISNHQSFLDPILATAGLARPGNYMARDTLFKNPLFNRLITSLNAFPIRRGKADTSALKEGMRRLKSGRTIVVFAEGTRTKTGKIGEFLPGVAMLSQRAAEWTVPVLIEGAYEAWPRTSLLPGPGRIYIVYGQPIHRDEAKAMKADAFVNRVRDELIDLQNDIRPRIGRQPFDYGEDG